MPTSKSRKKKTMPAKKRSGKSNVRVGSVRKISFFLNGKALAVFALLIAIVGTYLLIQSFANPSGGVPVKPFVTDAARGLQWAGLAQGTGACVHAYEMLDAHGQPQGCTHGPDPAPAGLDATKSVEPLTVIGGSTTPTATANVVCDGDGVSGPRVQVIYAHASDVADRYDTFASSFQQYADVVNSIFYESAQQTGGVRNVRFVTDASCNVVVARATLSTTGDDTFSNTITELKAQGYNRSDRKYMILVDANIYCGIAGISGDDQPGSTNANNSGPSYGRTDSGCWGGETEAHELTHNLGGVQLSAPHSTGAWHCNDEYDRLCYADGGPTSTMTYPCASAEEHHLDCNKDDYFNTNPASGSYLASHWDVANSIFLINGGGTSGGGTGGGTTLVAPTVTISSPTDGTVMGTKVNIKASAQAGSSAVQSMAVVIDGRQVTTVSGSTVSYTWNSRKTYTGTHTITVTATGTDGQTGQNSVTVIK